MICIYINIPTPVYTFTKYFSDTNRLVCTLYPPLIIIIRKSKTKQEAICAFLRKSVTLLYNFLIKFNILVNIGYIIHNKIPRSSPRELKDLIGVLPYMMTY